MKLSLRDGINAIRFKNAQITDYDFTPFGLKVFCGNQGAGKTLSAIRYVKQLCREFPAAILITNVKIWDLPCWTQCYQYNGVEDLFTYENGRNGIIFFIDEIHLEFNSLESKNIPISTITEISQMRKQRKMIIGTSQVAKRIAKPLREQFDKLVDCRNYFGVFQLNAVYDNEQIVQDEEGEINLDKSKCDKSYFFHSWKDYTCYDTFAKMRKYTRDIQQTLKKYDERLYGGEK